MKKELVFSTSKRKRTPKTKKDVSNATLELLGMKKINTKVPDFVWSKMSEQERKDFLAQKKQIKNLSKARKLKRNQNHKYTSMYINEVANKLGADFLIKEESK